MKWSEETGYRVTTYFKLWVGVQHVGDKDIVRQQDKVRGVFHYDNVLTVVV